MEERLNIRVTKEMHEFIEIYKLEKDLGDLSDAVREIILKEMTKRNRFFYKIKKLFFRFVS